jgi:hypothetical protein
MRPSRSWRGRISRCQAVGRQMISSGASGGVIRLAGQAANPSMTLYRAATGCIRPDRSPAAARSVPYSALVRSWPPESSRMFRSLSRTGAASRAFGDAGEEDAQAPDHVQELGGCSAFLPGRLGCTRRRAPTAGDPGRLFDGTAHGWPLPGMMAPLADSGEDLRGQAGCRSVQASMTSSTVWAGSGGTKPSISCRIGCTTGCSRFSAKAS